MNKIIYVSLIAVIGLTIAFSFNYAYAVDNNCRVNIIHIVELRYTLGCIEDRLDALENQIITDQTSASNLGAGAGVFAGEIGNDLQFKSLVAGNNTTIQSNATTITIHGTGASANATTASNTDNTVDSDIIPVFKNHTGNTLFFRVFNNTLNDGITIFYNDTYIWLVNTAKESTVCSNTGSGVAICNGTGGNVNLNSLIGSGGIDVTNTGDDLTIAPRYELLCQNTLDSTATSISCGAFTARQHLYVNLNLLVEGSSLESGIRFNSDSGTNYARRISFNNGADSTSASQTNCAIMGANDFQADSSSVVNFWVSNISSERKTASGLVSTDTGTSAGTAPSRSDFACKWSNTASQITTITFIRNGGTGNYDVGTELTVWGYD